MTTKIPTVGVIIIRGNEVLLVTKRNTSKQAWQLPGGQIEEGETAAEAASRELLENTCLRAEPAAMHKVPEEWEAKIKKDYGISVFSFICFVCKDYDGEPSPTSSAKPAWMPLDSLDTLLLNPNTSEAIATAQAMLR